MNLRIKNKKALVTGASRGIGRSVVLSLAKEGVKVACVSRTQKDLDSLLGQIGGKRNGHYYLAADLIEEGKPEEVVKKLKNDFGNVDIIVNNLGSALEINDPYCPVSDWRKLWRINMEIAIELNNLLIPGMKRKKWGRIVNISSISALENQGTVPYCSIKAALTAYSRSMGRILSKEGIIMTSLLPGAVLTRGGYWDKVAKSNPVHMEKFLNERMAIGRFGKPEEIARVVTFFCSKHASFCVGSTIGVDGGQGRCFF